MPTGLTGRRAAHPDLGGIEQADLPAGAPVGEDIGQGAEPDSALHGATTIGQQRADLPDGSGDRRVGDPGAAGQHSMGDPLAPHRIRLSRSRGWRKPSRAVGSVASGPELRHDVSLDAPAGVDLDALPGRPRAHRGRVVSGIRRLQR